MSSSLSVWVCCCFSVHPSLCGTVKCLQSLLQVSNVLSRPNPALVCFICVVWGGQEYTCRLKRRAQTEALGLYVYIKCTYKKISSKNLSNYFHELIDDSWVDIFVSLSPSMQDIYRLKNILSDSTIVKRPSLENRSRLFLRCAHALSPVYGCFLVLFYWFVSPAWGIPPGDCV